MEIKHKLLFTIIALRLLYRDVNFAKNINFSTLEIFLAASIISVASKKKSASVQSNYKGVLPFTDIIISFSTPNPTIPNSRIKIPSSDLGNPIYERALAQHAKEKSLNTYIPFCDIPIESNTYALVFGSETLFPGDILIGGVEGVTRDLAIVVGGLQKQYLLSDLMVHLQLPLALAPE